MWVHIIIFLLLPLIFLGVKAGLLPQLLPGNKKGKQLFFIVAVLGNSLGLFLTMEDIQKRKEFQDYRLERKENSSYEERFRVEIDGVEESIYIQIPQKEEEETGEILPGFQMSESELRQKEVKDSLAEFNEQKGDSDYYYLPEEINGKKITWEKQKDSSGSFLAGMCFVAAVALMILKSREEMNQMLKRREQMLMDYPGLVMKFTLLIQAGMSVRKAFRKLALDYRKRTDKKEHYAYEEILVMCYEMDTGISEAEAYRRFGERCGQVKYKTFSTLLIQNLQKGSHQLSDILEKESMEAWDERKRKARVLGEAAATKLLLPMGVMLMIVMAIIMIPACLTFYGGM